MSGRLKKTLTNLKGLLGHLPEAMNLNYLGFFGDVPVRTNWAEHDIDVGDAQPIHQHFYRVSPEKRKYLDAEVEYMDDNDIAVRSSSTGLLHVC